MTQIERNSHSRTHHKNDETGHIDRMFPEAGNHPVKCRGQLIRDALLRPRLCLAQVQVSGACVRTCTVRPSRADPPKSARNRCRLRPILVPPDQSGTFRATSSSAPTRPSRWMRADSLSRRSCRSPATGSGLRRTGLGPGVCSTSCCRPCTTACRWWR